MGKYKKWMALGLSAVMVLGTCLTTSVSGTEPEVRDVKTHALAGTAIDTEKETDIIAEVENVADMFMYQYNAGNVDATANLFLQSENTRLTWMEMLSFQPKEYKASYADYFKALTVISEMTVPGQSGYATPTGKDYVEIQQVMNQFTQNNRKDAMNLFASNEDISFYMGNLSYTSADLFGDGKAVTGQAGVSVKLAEMSEAEKANGYDFISIPFTSTPEILVNGDTAIGTWMVQTVDVKAGYYGCEYNSLYSDIDSKTKDMDAMIPVVRSICMATQEFVKENGQWKIQSYELNPLMTLPVEEYRWSNIAGFGHHSMQNANADTSFPYINLDNEWTSVDDTYDYQLADADDSMELQGYIARWANANKRRETLTFLDTLMAKDSELLYTFMKNSSSKPTVGYDNGVFAFMEKQTKNWNETLSIGHSGTTPLIYTYTDEPGVEHAIGYWVDHSWTNLAQIFKLSVTSDTIEFMLNINRYRHEFVKVDGEWKMLGFGFEPLIEIPKWKLEWKTCRGWGSLGLGAFTDTDMNLAYPQSFDLIKEETANKYFAAVTGVYQIKLADNSISVDTGKTYQAKASVYPMDSQGVALTWESLDESVAKVDANGKVTAVAPGKTTVTVAAEGTNVTANLEVTVSSGLKVQMENIQGEFLRYYMDGDLDKIGEPILQSK